jgi:hypothetical protein
MRLVPPSVCAEAPGLEPAHLCAQLRAGSALPGAWPPGAPGGVVGTAPYCPAAGSGHRGVRQESADERQDEERSEASRETGVG